MKQFISRVVKLNKIFKTSMNKSMISKIYAYSIVRWGIKFSLSFAIIKIVGDFTYYLVSDSHITIPRNNQVIGVQHPLNPPFKAPYPFENSVYNRMLNQKYRHINITTANILRKNKFEIEKLYTDVPMRQNPNQIDHFFTYSEAARIIEPIYYRVLQKMSQAGTQIPDGINQKLRELEQYRLQPIRLITPQL